MPLATELETPLTSRVLEAVESAIPADDLRRALDPAEAQYLGPKNEPLVPLLVALLDATHALACAVNENAWDDSLPLDRAFAERLANQAYRLGADLMATSQCLP